MAFLGTRDSLNQYEAEYRSSKEIPVIRPIWLLPAIAVLACEREVPHVDDPHNIVVNGEEMSQAAFLNKYCTEKIEDPTCSKVLDAATRNMLDRARNPEERR